jgi:hypothetical protein
MPAVVRLAGLVDVGALERGLAEVVQRHEVLRTRFATEDGQSIQVIDAAGAFRLEKVDLTGLDGIAAARRRPAVLVQEEASQRFDLSRGPLFRAKLVRLDAEDHVLLVTMHHIVSDGWSLGVLIREVAALYEAFNQERPLPLPELAVQYADYAVWQRGWLQGEMLAEQLGYWKAQLKGAPAALDLPTDRARPAVANFAGNAVHFALSRELSTKLAELGRREGVTLFMVLLAGVPASAGSATAVRTTSWCGSPVAGRSHRELEGLVGFFVNTLALRNGPFRRPLVPRAAQACEGSCAGGLCAPGPAVREAGAKSCSRSDDLSRHAAVPGQSGPAKHTGRSGSNCPV